MLPQEEHLETLEEWARSRHLGLTIVFTDIVESTKIGIKLGDTEWIEDLFLHFSRARELASHYRCKVVKAIGDSLMMAFDAPSDALKFAVDFSINTGVEYIGIRVAIYSGEVHIRDNDIYGLTVNHTSRVQGEIQREGILVGKSVMEAYNNTSGSLAQIRFSEEEKDLKDFGKEILCRANSTALRSARDAQRMARFDLLRSNVPREPRAPRL